MNLKPFSFIFLLASADVHAQTLSAFAGAGICYDGFLRDKTVMPQKDKKPFYMGLQTDIGLRYETGNTFDALLDINFGLTTFSVGLPPYSTRIGITQWQAVAMLGAGPHISMHGQNTLTPYIQLGAGYFGYWDSFFEYDDGWTGEPLVRSEIGRVIPVCGGGIDWSFKLWTMASFNLRSIYTPLNVFKAPVVYDYAGTTQAEQVSIQGKLLQTMFTVRVYLPLRKNSE